jgi:hypothetical protein
MCGRYLQKRRKVASKVKSLAEDLKSFLRDIEVYVSREAD